MIHELTYYNEKSINVLNSNLKFDKAYLKKKSIWLGIIGKFWVITPVTTVKIVAVCILKIYFPSFSASSPLVLHHSQPWSMTLAISTKKQRVQMIWQYATQPVTLDVHIDQLDTIALFIYHCKIVKRFEYSFPYITVNI